MLTIRHSGSRLGALAQKVRQAPRALLPYAASSALTRTAQHAARVRLPAQMKRVFDSPTPYTFNALRIEPAHKESLRARVLVKNTPSGQRLAQERFLLPQERGGARGQKRMERAFSALGALASGQYAMPAAGMQRDAHGNVRGSDVRGVLALLKKLRAVSSARSRDGKRLGRKLASSLFAGVPRARPRANGIWRREGHRLRPLFIFTGKAPVYGRRLDFAGTVQEAAKERFVQEFNRAVQETQGKGRA